MKKQIAFLLLSATIGFVACKQDVPQMYDQEDGIYFSAVTDSLSYTFAKYPNRTVDTIKLPVTVLGNPLGIDREISLASLTGDHMTGQEGVHYKLLPPYTMPANKVSALLPIVVFRTGDLDSLSAVFRIGLKENSHFKMGITSKSSIKIKTGFLQKPPNWGELSGLQWAGYSANLGTWTKTKYKVVLEALYDPVSDTTVSEFPYQRTSPPAIYLQYLQLVKNHIRIKYPGNYSSPLGIGPTLRDPDAANAVIQVGPANY